MSIKSRRKFSPEFKARVALEALRERETIETLCKKHDLHPSQINLWKKELKDRSSAVFQNSSSKNSHDESELIGELYKQIGELKVANEFLKKKLR